MTRRAGQPEDPPSLQPERAAIAFARALRGAGLDVPTGSVAAYVEALDAVGVRKPDDVYWAGRASLVKRPEDAAAYDRLFRRFWLGVMGMDVPPPVEHITVALDE